jgi:hypothetical protein
MKNILGVIFSLIIVVGFGDVCSAAFHPVEGSTNYMETDDEPVNSDCADIQFVFARGSGAPHGTSAEWLAFKESMTTFAEKRNYRAEVSDLAYPAVSIQDPLSNALGAFVSAGQYYAFGRSV